MQDDDAFWHCSLEITNKTLIVAVKKVSALLVFYLISTTGSYFLHKFDILGHLSLLYSYLKLIFSCIFCTCHCEVHSVFIAIKLLHYNNEGKFYFGVMAFCRWNEVLCCTVSECFENCEQLRKLLIRTSHKGRHVDKNIYREGCRFFVHVVFER